MKKNNLLIIFIFAFIFTFVKVRSFDLFFYLKIAEIESLLSPLKTNLFSYTFPDFFYRNYAFFFSELASFFTENFGIASLTILQSLVVSISYLVLIKSIDKRPSLLFLLSVLLLSLFTLRYRLLFRPHNLSYIFFVVNIYLLSCRPKHFLFFLFLNQILWVNTHNGFILGIINPLLLYPYDKQVRIGFLKTLAVLFLGSLISPHFYQPFKEVINPFLGDTKNIFQYIKVHEWQPADEKLYLSFYGILIIYSIYVIFKENKYRLLPFYIYYLLISIRFVRFIDFFALAAFWVVITARKGLIHNSRLKPLKLLTFAILLIFCVKDYFYNIQIPYGYGMADYFYPKGGVKYLKEKGLKGNVFNTYAFGSYMIYYIYPDCKPAIDGRLCYPLDFIKLYADAHENRDAFRTIVTKFKPDIFLIDYDHPKLAVFLTELKDIYTLVYFDDTSMIFLDRKKYADIVKADEIKYLNPVYVSGYSDINENVEEIKTELESRLKGISSNRGLVIYANLLLKESNIDKAKAILMSVAKSKSPIGKAESYNNLGTISLLEGNLKSAKIMFEKAISYNDNLAVAHFNLAQIYDEEKSYIRAYYHYSKFLKTAEEEVPAEVIDRLATLKNLSLFFLGRLIIGSLALIGLFYILYWKRRKKHSLLIF